MINGSTEQFQKFAHDYNKMMMDSWSSWTKQTIQSDSFASASGAMMDWSLATHKMMTELSGQMMESMDIPKRSDLARLSAQVQAVESRLLEREESQDEIRELLLTLMQKIDQMPAPVAAPVAQASNQEKSSQETVTGVLETPAQEKAVNTKTAKSVKGKAGNKK